MFEVEFLKIIFLIAGAAYFTIRSLRELKQLYCDYTRPAKQAYRRIFKPVPEVKPELAQSQIDVNFHGK